MRVGFATRTITVPPGAPMGGYAFREGVSAGTLDPLTVSAITWFDGTHRVALALLDVICVNADLTRAARAAVSGGSCFDVLWVAASHTHAGPETGCVPGGTATPPEWLARLTTDIAETVAVARDAEVETTGRVHSGLLHGVGAVRSQPAGEASVPLDVVEVVAGGRRTGVLVVLPVHPTVLPSDNLLVSADLTGAVRRALTDRLEPGTWVAVATGAAGDISTRRTRQGQDSAELDRLGALVADRCLSLLGDGVPAWSAGSTVAWRRRELTLDAKPPVDAYALIAAAERDIRDATDPISVRIAEGVLDGARWAASLLPDAPHSTERGGRARRDIRDNVPSHTVRDRVIPDIAQELPIAAEVAALRIGDVLLAGLPGEPFLTAATQLHPAIVLGYTNAYPGYLPPETAYADATYEVLASAAAPGCAELITAAAADLIRELTQPWQAEGAK
ncbi:MAG: hypothetical protein HOV77_17320 [Hamadaea sp.]|uniref:hypothetical protein n=1 Tax=Hamadaea sp. TaxID=2024425 RepID=UPI0017D2EAC0|nr:hypothetical protein [Hamadaea sp.]NUT20943.1 hypothetical protein [Hamadaea sp.]